MFDFADFTDITKMAITLLKMDGFSIFFVLLVAVIKVNNIKH